MSTIDFSNITNATTIADGTGYFDKLMNTINIQVNSQYQTGRLKGADYATVYLGLVQSAMAEAFKFELQKSAVEEGIALTTAKTATETDKLVSTAKARDVQEAQRRLYERQILGFDDNKQIKAFDAQLNSWALLNSSGMINSISIPAVISDANLTATYNSLTSDTNEALL